MNSNRVVLFCGDTLSPLLISGAKWVDGRVVSGDVVNGAWDFRVVGEEILAKGSNYIRNRWKYNVIHTVSVPPDVRGDYNEVIDWATKELK